MMKSYTTFAISSTPVKYLTGLFTVVTLLFSSAVFAQHDKTRKYEQFEILGQKTKPQLQREFDKAKFDFLDMYHEINEVAKFDVLCSYHRPLGSKIAKKTCEPRYVKAARALYIKTMSTSPGIDFNRLPSDEMIKFLTKQTREESYEHVAALVMTNPELNKSFAKLEFLHSRLNEDSE
ncbi:hypothetical protein [Alteromonas stellipolaris]|jgi:hypothetical protein|uniref:hypothetical protein n=1 Tax=Alteromonas stellipolaris TaxID=233316 RepID=UPI001E622A60|nr:hypothetical protein [Alteromonas stellipolaris]